MVRWVGVMVLVLMPLVTTGGQRPLSRHYPTECVPSGCSTDGERATRWPFTDPNFYQRCEPDGANGWTMVRVPCQQRRLFHFPRQACTEPDVWEEPCPADGTVPPLPTEPCPTPQCATIDDLRTLWPDEEPDIFHQCMPGAMGGWTTTRHQCPNGMLFSIRHQSCITEFAWYPECTTGTTTDDGQLTTTTAYTSTSTTSTSTTDEPEWSLCEPPLCFTQDPLLYPHTNRLLYWQCVPEPSGFWVPLERPCASGTYFHYEQQHCVFPADWVNFCGRGAI